MTKGQQQQQEREEVGRAAVRSDDDEEEGQMCGGEEETVTGPGGYCGPEAETLDAAVQVLVAAWKEVVVWGGPVLQEEASTSAGCQLGGHKG